MICSVVVLVLVCGVFDMVAFGLLLLWLVQRRIDLIGLYESRCNSAKEVCWICGLCSF